MKLIKTLIFIGLFLFTNETFSQDLPESYQAIFNEVIENFESIRGANTVTQGKTTLGVVNKNKVTLYLEYKNQVKNLVFERGVNETDSETWVATNQVTIDMVNKHEDFLSKELEKMLKLSEKRSKE